VLLGALVLLASVVIREPTGALVLLASAVIREVLEI
jgi:hypothetical protein